MNWFKAFNEALTYIEDNILEDIDSEEVARIAACSRFHFLRTFGMLTGMPLSEYIRNRRLTLAVSDIVNSDLRIIDIALKYGYETPEAFGKAFKKLHSVSPSMARKGQVQLKAVLPLSFQITIKGEEHMDYRIEKKEGFKLVGKSIRVTSKDGENFKIIPQFWQDVMVDGSFEKMMAVSNTSFGVCYDNDIAQEAFNYMIGVEGEHIDDLPEVEILDVPESTWAIFKSIGPMPHAIQAVWKRIFNEWFPGVDYEHADGPELEVYLPGDPDSDDYICEVWIPIVGK